MWRVRVDDRHAGMNRRAPSRLRFDSELTIDKADPLLHRNETNAAMLRRRDRVESSPLIADDQMNPAVRLPQADTTLPGTTVLRRVVKRLLQDPKQAQ